MASSDKDSGSAGGEEEGGELVFFGSTDWAAMGRKDADKKGGNSNPNAILSAPHRVAGLTGLSISFVASGCVSCNCLAVDRSGQLYSWGRNEQGQLGHGDQVDRNQPTVVAALKGMKVSWAASGRSHSVVVLDDGRSYSWGHNKHGQLGLGSYRTEVESSPKAVQSLSKAKAVACGSEFTAWITEPQEGAAAPSAGAAAAGAAGVEGATLSLPNLLTAGLPQYGQLGHGTDNQYNAKEGTVKIVFEPQPTPRRVATLAGRTITKIACGNNHTVAADSEGFLWTWGFGGHGRLGHREQKDEFKPRRVDIFQRTNILPSSAVVAAGSAFSACTAGGGQLYMWGRVKPTGDNVMYPKPNMDLSGWNIRRMDCGGASSCVAADNSCITWGTAHHGELGYGPKGPKSSANPKKVEALENFHSLEVACGLGFTMVVLSRSHWAGKPGSSQAHIDKLPLFEPSEDAPVAKGAGAKPKKGLPNAAQGKASKSKAKVEVEEPSEDEDEGEEEEEEEEEEEDEEYQGKKKKTKKVAAAKKRKAPAKPAAKKAEPARKSSRSRK